jgi:hypothetical protein
MVVGQTSRDVTGRILPQNALFLPERNFSALLHRSITASGRSCQ